MLLSFGADVCTILDHYCTDIQSAVSVDEVDLCSASYIYIARPVDAWYRVVEIARCLQGSEGREDKPTG